MTNTTPPAIADVELRETIAREIDPVCFKAHDSLYDYCIKHGDDDNTAARYADDTHGPDCNKALAKADAILALQAAQHRQEDVAGMREDTRLLDMLRDECWDLRCFDVPTGGDDYETNWRVIGHWQAEPRERVIAEGYSDDPRVALRAALDRNQLTGEKDG